MKIRTSKAFLTLLAFSLIVLPGFLPTQAAQAQTETALDSVRVEIWPEYDQPSALIIYNVSLSPSVSLPATMKFRIPAAAGKPYAVAWQAPDQGLYDLKYTLSAAGDWVEVSFDTPAPDLRLEFYDPEIQKTSTKRNFVFRWPGDYTVKNLSLVVQQPVNATNMSLSPDAGSGRQAADGMTYYTLVAGQVNAGTTFELAISYDKSDDTLTNPEQYKEALPAQAVDGSTAGRVTLDQTLPWAVGGLGVLLMVGGLIWYWRMNAAGSQGSGKGVHRHARAGADAPAAPAAASGAAAEPGGPAFCHHCGKKANPGDVFCRTCGTRLH